MRVKYYHDMAAWADARTQAGRRESADKGSHDLADAAGPTCMAEPTRPGRRGPRCSGRRSLADAGRCRQAWAGADRRPKRVDGGRRGRADAAGPTRADAGRADACRRLPQEHNISKKQEKQMKIKENQCFD